MVILVLSLVIASLAGANYVMEFLGRELNSNPPTPEHSLTVEPLEPSPVLDAFP
jgi:hypothetical protein